MSYLLDTNVVSETFRSTPNPNVLKWFKQFPSEELFISVLTLGEIRKGIQKIQDEGRKQKILFWLEHDLIHWFEDRILPIDAAVADKWGYIMLQSAKFLPAIDCLIAATALVHNLKIVTRNVKDFNIEGLEVINPWETF